MVVAITGASAVRSRSRGRVLGLHDACSGGAHSEGHACTVGIGSGRSVLVLGIGAHGERSADTIVELAVVLADVLVRSADGQRRAHPVGSRCGGC